MTRTTRLSRSGPRLCIATSLALAAATLGGMAPAHAAPPSNPSGLSVSQPNDSTTILSWSPSIGASSYRIVIDDDLSFTTPAATGTTVNTTFVPKNKLASGTWNWRVQAVGTAGESSDWTLSSFAASEVSTPVPSSPANGAVLQQPDNAPLLSWSASPGATSYKVEVSKDSFTTVDSYTTQTTSLAVSRPLSLGSWSWRVTAYKSTNPDIQSLPSDPQSFVIAALQTPELKSPIGTTVTDVVLDWEPVEGASAYELQVSQASNFSTLVDNRTSTGLDGPVLGTRYSPTTTYDNGTYFWRVRAIDTAGNTSNWAAAASFTRGYRVKPNLLHPAQGDLTVPNPVYFEWTAVSHASEYEIQVGTDPNFSLGTYNSCRLGGTTYTPGLFRIQDTDNPIFLEGEEEECDIFSGVPNYWHVRALDRPFNNNNAEYPGVQSDEWSATGSFTPVDFEISGLSVSQAGLPTISWNPVEGADTYSVSLAGPSPSPGVTTHATSWTPDGLQVKPGGTYTVTVQAKSLDGTSSRVARREFTMPTTIPTSGADPLTLLGPAADAEINAVPRMTWEPQPGAAYYKVFVRDSSNTAVAGTDSLFEKPVPYPTVTDTSARLEKPGSYWWQVVAYDSAHNALGASAERMFTVTAVAAPTGQAIALGGRALDPNNPAATTRCQVNEVCQAPATPVLKWDPVPGTSFYMVYVSENASFTTLLEPTRVPATTNTMYAPTQNNLAWTYADSDAQIDDPSYYWYVRPCRSMSLCTASPRSSSGAAQHSFTKKSPAVEGLQSVVSELSSTPVGTGSEVTLSWDDYWRDPASTSEFDKWQPTGEPLPQSAQKYRVEVASNSTFTDQVRVDLIDVDQTTYTSFEKVYAPGSYWWRVQAIDGDDNALTWSEPATFTVVNPKVSLVTPAAGATVASTTSFTWEAQAYSQSYEIEVYRADTQAEYTSPTYSLGNRVVQAAGVRTTAWTWNQPLAQPGYGYVWRVRRKNSSGHNGQWSDPGRFFVSESSVNITSPADGASQPPNGPVLVWDPVPGAASYAVSILPTTGSGTTDSDTTPATAYAPTKLFVTGSYQFTIAAKDAVGNTLSSASRTFVVDNRLAADRAVEISAPEGFAVGKTLHVVPPTWVGGSENVTVTYQWLVDGTVRFGASGETFTPASQDFGKQVAVRATGKRPGYADGVSTSESVTIGAGDALVNTVKPTIAGTAKPGGALSASTGSWSQLPSSYGYQWLRNGAAIAGETRSLYSVKAEDAGTLLSVRITAVKAGYANGIADSDAVAVAATPPTDGGGGTDNGTGGAVTPTSLPTLAGTASVGSFLSVRNGTWNPSSGVLFTYQWLRDGAPISGATSTIYQVTADDIGHTLSVTVTASRSGMTNGAAASAGLAVPKATSTTTITGYPTVIKPSQRAKVTITVKVPGIAKPTGKLVIKDGRKTLKKLRLKASKKGTLTYQLPRLKPKKHKIKVIYKGSPTILKSKSKALKIKVRR